MNVDLFRKLSSPHKASRERFMSLEKAQFNLCLPKIIKGPRESPRLSSSDSRSRAITDVMLGFCINISMSTLKGPLNGTLRLHSAFFPK